MGESTNSSSHSRPPSRLEDVWNGVPLLVRDSHVPVSNDLGSAWGSAFDGQSGIDEQSAEKEEEEEEKRLVGEEGRSTSHLPPPPPHRLRSGRRAIVIWALGSSGGGGKHRILGQSGLAPGSRHYDVNSRTRGVGVDEDSEGEEVGKPIESIPPPSHARQGLALLPVSLVFPSPSSP
eukprot:9496714-Pyramimonas_sp.AAC.3